MIGVVIARFQTPSLHEGHRKLLEYVVHHHEAVLVLLGVRHTPANLTLPLSYTVREQMVRAAYPHVTILPVHDCRSDEEWSAGVDRQIATAFPFQAATIYGGRDSAITHYMGHHATRMLDLGIDTVSGTAMRERIKHTPRHTDDFRAGIIYSFCHLPPRNYLCVDIAMVLETKVLLVKRDSEEAWRFPGGFVDSTDESLEHAARRELAEETGLTVEHNLEYIGSAQINDWRTRDVQDARHITTFWRTQYTYGSPTAGDDVDLARWFPLYDLPIVPEHRVLHDLLIKRHEHDHC